MPSRQLADALQSIRANEDGPQNEVGYLERTLRDGRLRVDLTFPHGLELQADHRPLHELWVDRLKFTRGDTGLDQSLDLGVLPLDGLTLCGELGLAEYGVAVVTAGVERKSQIVVRAEGEEVVEAFGMADIERSSLGHPAFGLFQIGIDELGQNEVLRGEVVEQRRLSDAHRLGDVAGGGAEVAALTEEAGRVEQDLTPCIDTSHSPTLPIGRVLYARPQPPR